MLQFKTIAIGYDTPRVLTSKHFEMLKDVLIRLQATLKALDNSGLLDNPSLPDGTPHSFTEKYIRHADGTDPLELARLLLGENIPTLY